MNANRSTDWTSPLTNQTFRSQPPWGLSRLDPVLHHKVFATHSLRAVAVMVEECNAVVYDVQTQKAACSRFSDTSNDISVQNSTAVCASGKVCTSSTGTWSPKMSFWHVGPIWTFNGMNWNDANADKTHLAFNVICAFRKIQHKSQKSCTNHKKDVNNHMVFTHGKCVCRDPHTKCDLCF